MKIPGCETAKEKREREAMGGKLNEDNRKRVRNKRERVHTDGQTTNKQHNKQTAQQSGIPLTLA